MGNRLRDKARSSANPPGSKSKENKKNKGNNAGGAITKHQKNKGAKSQSSKNQKSVVPEDENEDDDPLIGPPQLKVNLSGLLAVSAISHVTAFTVRYS